MGEVKTDDWLLQRRGDSKLDDGAGAIEANRLSPASVAVGGGLEKWRVSSQCPRKLPTSFDGSRENDRPGRPWTAA